MSNQNVQATSAAAYASLTNLGDRQRLVRQAIATLGTACNQMIANHLGVPVNQITGRVFELREMGIVVQARKDIWPPTGKTVIWWQIAAAAPATPAAPGAAAA